ncbi:hypothetical protein PFFVO_06039 [Plasmodium falciparum Vietnam Oak-Knoll (FVO)]|uniref:Erythrocyte membrane protein 1, PfEMP1 n=2 Tax=Plasmodium falciparum TaxID=5833 RepID=A0A024UW83_PLAFA|nr:hypothetical protein PFFVO_06039 [Plasmodium falciparum Vietnam Oak-Knoll (FVO)]
MHSEDNTLLFSNYKCGHYEDAPPTNLDYVPQFLRWFDEWSEDFCRIKKIKLGRVKKACRDESSKLYCSHNGYDCTKTIRNKDICIRESKCTGCLVKCNPYEIWLENQRKEFDKQKEKYEKEINEKNTSRDSTNNSINNIYYEDFYKKYKEKTYNTVNEFIKLLNEGKYCKEKLPGKEIIDFTNIGEKGTFYRSEYCQPCPDCGVICENGKCVVKENGSNCRHYNIYEPAPDVKTTEINVIVSGDEQGIITKKLQDFCMNPNNENGTNNQIWKCYYKDEKENKCKVETKSGNSTYKEKITSFDEFFDFWVRKLLIDTIKWETELTYCINNTTNADCNNECNKNCVCFDKWVKQKEKEWKNIMDLFTNKHDIPKKYYLNINDLFNSFFFQVIYKFNEGEAKWNKLKENLKKKIESSKKNKGTKDSEAAIKVLFDHLKETATICKDNNTNEACDPTGNPTQNPCINNTTTTSGGNNKHATVKQIAQYYKRQAYSEANNRSDGLYKLKGKAHEGIYKRGGRAKDFKYRLCKIGKNHSNRDPKRSDGPCYGKNEHRFEIGKVWSHVNEKKTTYTDVYLPQRREHMCTSYLEYLQTNISPLNGMEIVKNGKNGKLVNDSFLGDVLLSAKFEGDYILKNFNKKNKAVPGICRAMKYSFADIGDIIRGRDMWDLDDGSKKMEDIFKKIFGTLHKSLDGIKDKYKEGEPYTKLREDWWEANRHQVWRAMKCAIKGLNVKSSDGKLSDHCGYSDHTPLDDYIPQRLRWMTEWAEWYCKEQKKQYHDLVNKCKECKKKDNGGHCWKDSAECTECDEQCKKYKKFIDTWQPQWDKIRAKYKKIYEHARVDIAANGGLNTSTAINDNEDKPVIEFLFELYKANGGKISNPAVARATVNGISTDDTTPTVYSTAAGYIHQEMPIVGCKGQEVFCDNNGNKEKYAFKNPPNVYDEACKCENNTKPPPPTTPSTPNPCVNGGDKTRVGKITSVTEIATKMHGEANETMLKNSSNGNDKGESKLKGKAEEGDYSRGGNASDFKDICKITKIHSNARSNKSNNPCDGKNQKRFNVGTEWKDKDFVNPKYPGIYMPPRRQHMCTSNLEYLLSGRGGQFEQVPDDKASDSFLGDVLVAAKKEAENIKKLYETNNRKSKIDVNDEATICRAIRYSFADIGDIIRGTDLWDINGDVTGVQSNLQTVFGKIKKQFNGKYTNDSKHTQLRADWWEANRKQIWQAMTCPQNGIKCDKDPPLDDYIPQRLRWMTEWAEWYCKVQKEEYEELEKQCSSCKSNGGKCMNGEAMCTDCRNACEVYKTKIEPWKKQWEKIKEKYQKLYEQAKNNTGATTSDSNDQQVIEFLSKLHEKNSENKIYSTAEGYVHQEAHISDCQKQTQFCKKRNGEIPSSDTETDNNYAFRPQPHDHDTACKCKDRQPELNDDVCETVKEHIGNKNGTQAIDHCNPKYQGAPYPGWNCTDKIKKEEKGACMPPRRQKLCVINLQHFKENTSVELRKAFIQCAAAETFLLWHKYKTDNNGGEELQNQLESGIIPEDFKRQMFYTFGDYRDLCLDKNIGSDVSEVEKNIKRVFSSNGDKTPNGQSRLDWWGKNCQDIWQGMLCGLSHASGNISNVETIKNNNTYDTIKFSGDNRGPTLEEFSKRPQFLRWMIEWGEHFCRERKTQLDKLVEQCGSCGVDPTGNTCNGECKECKNQCIEYQRWIKTWQDNYKKQKERYTQVKNNPQYNNDSDVLNSQEAYQYLNKKLEKICPFGTSVNCEYKYMERASLQNGKDMPASLDEEPQEVKGRCTCQKAPQPPARPPPPPPPPPPQQARPQGDGRHDHRARSEDRENRAAGPRSPQPAPTGEGLGRSLGRRSKEEEDEDEEEEELENDDGEDEVQEDTPEEVKDNTQEEVVIQQETTGTTKDDNVEKVCDTVKKALAEDTLKQACSTKYEKGREKFPNWKCIPTSGVSTTTGKDGATGSICIPPRRRRLYIHKVDDGEFDEKSLRKWFIESAAVETFFLWDRYKKENTKKTQGVGSQPQTLDGNSANGDDEDPQKKLQESGKIPDGFLRQMFYTLGDYRDILFSGSKDEKSGDRDIFNADKEIQEREKNIKEKIKTFFSNSGNQSSTSGKDRKTWWENNAKHIWEGMVCALTHKTDNPQEVDDDVKGQLLENGKPQSIYQYNQVKLDEDSGPKGNDDTKLENFVERPPYFRYLEEWGEEFCRKRIHKLDIIEKECKVEANGRGGGKKENPKCSGYGEHCEDNLLNKSYDTVPSLECPGCGRECRKYKKWIERKKIEFTKQSGAYDGQKKKCVNGNNKGGGDNGFCVTLTTSPKAAEFLQKLGPCKKDSGEANIDFGDKTKTFGPSENCKPCPKFTVKCKVTGNCSKDEGDNCKGTNKNSISADDIKDENDSTEDLVMLVSDNDTNKFDGDLSDCQGADIFEGIRKEQWKCGKVCGYVVCKSEKGNGETGSGKKNDDKHIITIRALVTHWVYNFLEDYNRIRKKLNPCIKKDNGSTCINGCEKKCKCVGQWITKKREEWGKIKDRFNDQYKNKDSGDYPVKTILEELIPQIAAATDKGNHKRLQKLVKSLKCNCTDNSEKEGDKDANKKDIIDCLLDKLKKKTESCPTPTSDHTQTACVDSTHLEDEEPLEEEEENPVTQPNICPQQKPETKVVDEDACITDAPQPDVKEEEEEKEEEKDKEDEEEEEEEEEEDDEDEEEEEEESVSDTYDYSDSETEEDDEDEYVTDTSSHSESQPKRLPRDLSPELKKAMLFSTILWMVGIGFAAICYFLLKKKEKGI